MNYCEHDIEYLQEVNDIKENIIQVRCLKCGYQSYSIYHPSDKYRFRSPAIQGQSNVKESE